MSRKWRWTAVVVALSLAGCGAGGYEIVIAATAHGDALAVTNQSDVDLVGTRIIVQSREEGEGGTGRICANEDVGTWVQGESRIVPRCGEKTLLRIETDGGTAEFVYVNDTLYRKMGRKEIPVS